MPNNKTITPVGIWSQHGAFLSLYVALLEGKVVAPQGLFSLILLSEYKKLTHLQMEVKSVI